MSSSDEPPIRFTCPHCTSPVRAPASQAGERLRCPFCYSSVEVPSESASSPSAGYELRAGNAVAADAPPSVVVDCPVCRTRTTAPLSAVGRQIVCEDCGTPILVRAPQPRAHATRPAATEGADYALREEPREPTTVPREREEPMPTARAVPVARPSPAPPPKRAPAAPQAAASADDQSLIHLTCAVCGTLMYATRAQIGRRLVCPDCGTPSPVIVAPKPRPAPSANPPRGAGGEYGLAADWSSNPAATDATAPPVESEEYAFHCLRCQSLLYAARNATGGVVLCPECGTPNMPPPPRPAEVDHAPPSKVEFGVSSQLPPARPTMAPLEDRLRPRAGAIEPGAADEDEHYTTARPQGPRSAAAAMLLGVFDCPWTRGCFVRWLGLVAGAFIVALLTAEAAFFFSGFSGGGGYFAIGTSVVGLVLAVTSIVVGLGWATVFAVNLMTVLSDTAAGNNQIVNWPDPWAFWDWLSNTLYVASALAFSMAIGGVIAGITQSNSVLQLIWVSASTFLLFPVTLLSMLNAGSLLAPVSLAVYRTLFYRAGLWTAFYIESLLLAALGSTLLSLLIANSTWTAVCLVLALMLPTFGIIYFRLLGRVAWCCSEYFGGA